MKNETFKDDTVYPVNMSAGGVNAFYVSDCDTVGHRPSYCICVNKIQAFERTGKLDDYTGCGIPISNRTCVALAMRNREIAAGHTLYFIHREKLKAFNDARNASVVIPAKGEVSKKKRAMIYPDYVQKQMSSSEEVPVESVSLDKSSVIYSVDTGSYAEAISAAVHAEPLKPTTESPTEKVVVTGVVPIPGETLLEMARRMMTKQPGEANAS